MRLFKRQVPPPKPYDDVLYKFTHNGRDYTSPCPELKIAVPVKAGIPYGDTTYHAVRLMPVGMFIDGEYFSKATE